MINVMANLGLNYIYFNYKMTENLISASEKGFAFERRIGYVLEQIKENLEPGWTFLIKGEQEIREHFKEPSLNGVDHMIQVQTPTGEQHVFLLQEKWKLITNQREVSQFLDCCARILARMPQYGGTIHRMWISRTVPSANGEKSLQEGQCILVQTCTSQTMLAINTALIFCEVLGRRDLAVALIESIGSLMPSKEEAIADPKAAQTEPNTFEPVSDFGEKRVLPITNKTIVMVKKVD
jgi:hypothetical protein